MVLLARELSTDGMDVSGLYDFHFEDAEAQEAGGVEALARRSTMFAPHNPGDRTSGTDSRIPAYSDSSAAIDDDEGEEEPVALSDGPVAAGVVAMPDKQRTHRRRSRTEQDDLNAFVHMLTMADQRTRKAVVLPSSNPAGLLYPGSLQDRCFVVGSASDVWADDEDEELRVRPHIPRAGHKAYTSLAQYHAWLSRVQEARLGLKEPGLGAAAAKVVVYAPALKGWNGEVVAVPLDRQLRGLYFAFLLALCLERWLLVDVPELHALYAAPHNTTWAYTDYAERLHSLPSLTVNASHTGLLRSADLQALWPSPVLYYRDLITHDRALLSNPHYRWIPPALFRSQSRVERTAQVMRHLLSAPRPALLTQAQALMAVLHLRAPGVTSVGVRVDFPDEAALASPSDPLPSVSAHYLRCLDSVLQTYAGHPNATRILFTTNRPSKASYDHAARLLSPYGHVVTYADSLRRLRQRMEALMGGAPVTVAAERLIGHAMAELDVAVFSDTTFGVFQGARTGWGEDRGGLSVVVVDQRDMAQDSDDEYCGPIRRTDRPKRMDIVY